MQKASGMDERLEADLKERSRLNTGMVHADRRSNWRGSVGRRVGRRARHDNPHAAALHHDGVGGPEGGLAEGELPPRDHRVPGRAQLHARRVGRRQQRAPVRAPGVLALLVCRREEGAAGGVRRLSLRPPRSSCALALRCAALRGAALLARQQWRDAGRERGLVEGGGRRARLRSRWRR